MSATHFSDKFIAGIVGHLNEDHRRELLDLAHGLAGQTWVTEAEAATLDTMGLGLLLRDGERSEQLRISFEPPLERPNQVRPTLISLIWRARAQLGLPNPRVAQRASGRRG